MSGKLKRYHHPKVIEHLAANYVLGPLPKRVRRRVNNLRQTGQYPLLNQRIQFWQHKMSPLDDKIPSLAPKTDTWHKIQAQINPPVHTAPSPWYRVFTPRFYQWTSACSLLMLALLSVYMLTQAPSVGPLSYVAVLADDKQNAQLVAATYGQSQTLLLDIVELPEIASGETLELWVTSKTDRQTRSLGEIPLNVSSFARKLTTAQWRLIKDSESLLISIEEAGGSAIGEPSGTIVARGACVRLSAWQTQS